mmetsp:Transcript_26853/g.37475  ORF Transcript_26853/g.37475 Transcript_26853/m.37475 type:complete len:306 (-) Transcript_26853:176-1093(-)
MKEANGPHDRNHFYFQRDRTAPGDRTIVVLPELGMSAEEASSMMMVKWKNIPSDISVVLVEWPGHGYNGRQDDTRFRGYNIPEAARWLHEFLQVIDMGSSQDLTIFGFGYGGGVALHYLNKHPDAKRILRYCLVNPVVFEILTENYMRNWCQTTSCEHPVLAWYDLESYYTAKDWESVPKPILSSISKAKVRHRQITFAQAYWEKINRHVFYSSVPLNKKRLKFHALSTSEKTESLMFFGEINKIVDYRKSDILKDMLPPWKNKTNIIVNHAGHVGYSSIFPHPATIFDVITNQVQEFLFKELLV